MPVLPTTAYSQAEDALRLARALVNDSAGVVLTDTLLMPPLNSAYRALQRELARERRKRASRAARYRVGLERFNRDYEYRDQ